MSLMMLDDRARTSHHTEDGNLLTLCIPLHSGLADRVTRVHSKCCLLSSSVVHLALVIHPFLSIFTIGCRNLCQEEDIGYVDGKLPGLPLPPGRQSDEDAISYLCGWK